MSGSLLMLVIVTMKNLYFRKWRGLLNQMTTSLRLLSLIRIRTIMVFQNTSEMTFR